MDGFQAKNKTALAAQLSYPGVGNPPSSQPQAAVGNFFPGLEFNFQNVWKRIFVGIELLESSGQLISVDLTDISDELTRSTLRMLWLDPAKESLACTYFELKQAYLVRIDYMDPSGRIETIELLRYGRGPGLPSLPPKEPDFNNTPNLFFLEWANALIRLHHFVGGNGKATCHFLVLEQEPSGSGKLKKRQVDLEVRRLLRNDVPVIRADVALPGELTESLCSPWQTDYIGCACFYWASNRPDFVNVEVAEIRGKESAIVPSPVTASGDAADNIVLGQHWLDVPLDPTGRVERDVRGRIERMTKDISVIGSEAPEAKPFYTLDAQRLLQHEDVMKDWESKLEFVIGGNDTPDGAVAPAIEPPSKDEVDQDE